MTAVDSTTSILSYPNIYLAGVEEGKVLARKANEFAASLRDADPSHFGFFATIPSLLDIEAALTEIRFAFDNLNPDGVMLLSHYDTKYLGHPSFTPIWAELNARQAVVFVHPVDSPNETPVNKYLPPPILEYPQNTTKTAFDMIINGVIRSFPDCKVILSHAGGTLPYLISRGASLLPTFAGFTEMSQQEIIEDAKTFYFDLALSCTSYTLDTLLSNFPRGHILFGSDFPYGPSSATIPLCRELDSYKMDDETRAAIYFDNALSLFPRLRT
jgi:6-methylsalicylate decarboxylase